MLNLIDKNKSSIHVGDINIDIIKYEDDRVLNYLTVLLSNKYLPYITVPTRVSYNRPTGPTATSIDHIFVKFSNVAVRSHTYAGIFNSDISYHLPCSLSIATYNNSKHGNTRAMVRLFGDKNCNKFAHENNFVICS